MLENELQNLYIPRLKKKPFNSSVFYVARIINKVKYWLDIKIVNEVVNKKCQIDSFIVNIYTPQNSDKLKWHGRIIMDKKYYFVDLNLESISLERREGYSDIHYSKVTYYTYKCMVNGRKYYYTSKYGNTIPVDKYGKMSYGALSV
jgi:hypothetical protein